MMASIKECIEENGIRFQDAGIDTQAEDVEKEARFAEFEAMHTKAEATATALKGCLKTSGVIDPENFKPGSIDLEALKGTMDECLADAGIDLPGMRSRFQKKLPRKERNNDL